jgi:hypothetical protein
VVEGSGSVLFARYSASNLTPSVDGQCGCLRGQCTGLALREGIEWSAQGTDFLELRQLLRRVALPRTLATY